jgi:hypothetical protein
MTLKTAVIIIISTVLVSSALTYFITREVILYNPLDIPEIRQLKHESAVKDSLNNAIIESLKNRIEDKQYIIDNVLQKQITESQNKVKHYSSKKEDEVKYINMLDELQLQNDINSKLLRRNH